MLEEITNATPMALARAPSRRSLRYTGTAVLWGAMVAEDWIIFLFIDHI